MKPMTHFSFPSALKVTFVFVDVVVRQLAGVGVLALSIWLLFDQAVVFMAKGDHNYATGTYILLAAGALMTVIGFLGCCGALRESQCLLGTVSSHLISIFLSEIYFSQLHL